MPWKEVSAMSARREFVTLATAPGANVRELSRRFGISPTTAYKWIERGEQEQYADRSRRPHHSPNRTAKQIEDRILAIRDQRPYWNARKIRRQLSKQLTSNDHLPAASTVGEILRRNGRITEEASAAVHRWHRFEHDAPNDLSQIDFMGHFAVGSVRCHALTMVDDHSRYAQLLEACTDERTDTVRKGLIKAFRRYGVPRAMNMDNGHPFGNPTTDPYTRLTVWLMRIGVRVSHSRPRHPQTNGKDERFHRTIQAELVSRQTFQSIPDVQFAFDWWRDEYNHQRPHESLALEVPASRYLASRRSYPEILPPIEYNDTDLVTLVQHNGMAKAWGREFYVGQAFRDQLVALRQTADDTLCDVFFCNSRIRTVDRSAARNG